MDLNALSSLIAAMRPSFRSLEQQQLDFISNAWTIAVGESIAAQARPIAYERQSLTIAVRQGSWAQQLTAQTYQILQRLRPQLPPTLTIKTLRFRVAPRLCSVPRDPPQASPSPTSQPIAQIPTLPEAHPSHWPRESDDRGRSLTFGSGSEPSDLESSNSEPSGLESSDLEPSDLEHLGLEPSNSEPSNSEHLDSNVKPESASKLNQVVDRWRFRLNQRAPNLKICPRCHCRTPPAELDRWRLCALCATTLFQSPMALGGQLSTPEIERAENHDDPE